jgi:hypothetical protein
MLGDAWIKETRIAAAALAGVSRRVGVVRSCRSKNGRASPVRLRTLFVAVAVSLVLPVAGAFVQTATSQPFRLSVAESRFDSVFAYPFIAAANGYFRDADRRVH